MSGGLHGTQRGFVFSARLTAANRSAGTVNQNNIETQA
jgi:hypothetical protein